MQVNWTTKTNAGSDFRVITIHGNDGAGILNEHAYMAC